ncbi:transglutaminase family protein cysteine peptidase BTLCP, partial [Methylorubrum extorquens DSM 13060]
MRIAFSKLCVVRPALTTRLLAGLALAGALLLAAAPRAEAQPTAAL